MKQLKNSLAAVIALGLALFGSPAQAQGVTSNQILLGASLPLTGPTAPATREQIDGALAYFDLINKRGGVHGRKIAFEIVDDQQDAKIAIANTQALIEEKKVLALFMYRTSSSIEAVLPMTEKAQVPFLFPQVGPAAVYDPKHQWVFTIRAAYQLEAQRAVEQLVKLGIKQIAILQVTDAFGKDAIKGVEKALAQAGLQPAGIVQFDNKTADVTEAIEKFSTLKPQAVVMIGNAKGCAAFVKGMHLRNTSPMMISLSNTSSASYITEMGDAGRGVGITQVVPNPIRGSGLSIDFMEMRKNAPTVAASHSAFQGYLSARVLVDAFQRAGKNLDRTRLKSALESMSVDYYGFKMKFTPSDRHGSDFVELSVVGKDGKLRL